MHRTNNVGSFAFQSLKVGVARSLRDEVGLGEDSHVTVGRTFPLFEMIYLLLIEKFDTQIVQEVFGQFSNRINKLSYSNVQSSLPPHLNHSKAHGQERGDSDKPDSCGKDVANP
jgi:hypothetical protein